MSVHLEVSDYYDQLNEVESDPARVVGWQSRETQRLRFLALSLIGDLTDATVLDVGCGWGDFFGFCREEGMTPQYEGVDCSGKMISQARVRYPQASFYIADYFKSVPEKKYDFLFGSGIFSLLPGKTDPYFLLQNGLERLYSQSKKGVGVTLLSSYAEAANKPSIFTYYQPERVLGIALGISKFVELKHHYLPNDFTILLHR